MTKNTSARPIRAPESPAVKRFVEVERLQMVGIPILAAVAIAGLFGAFDDTSARTEARGAPLAVHVEFPSRIQYEQSKPLLIEVRNESSHAVGEVAIEIDRAYLEGFQAETFLPEPDEITPEAYVVEVGAIQAGEVRRIALVLSAEQVGRQRGQVRVTSGARRLAAIDLSTFVFP